MSPTNNKELSMYTVGDVLVLYKAPAPDAVVVDLFYQDPTETRNNAGGLVLSWRYRVNSVYDPDPLLGTGAISGFVEWAAFYDRYRVINFSYDVDIVNMENFPVALTAAPTLLDVGANYASTIDLAAFPYGSKRVLGSNAGQGRSKISGQLDLALFEGSPSVYTDNNYSSVVNTNPVNIRFMNIGIIPQAALVNGVYISSRMGYRVLFYQRLNLPS
jgi:hypothetical protein